MPYIEPKKRDKFLEHINAIGGLIDNCGDFNFVISSLLHKIIHKPRKLNYALINDVIGVLECAKLEFYRRVAIPYENAKMAENGDVYN